ncbi:MAG TPA: FAD-binding oxidoreductase, partial [Acidimicrobiales bacterium]
AVAFAREKGIRLVVKGTGHDYLGRSSAPDSLLIWTHRMPEITVHNTFRPSGAGESGPAVPAVTVGAGVRWLEAYQALAPHGRYVQGGGCTSVGAAGGFTQGGGFGSFSRRYGTAAGNALEAEVVTASGEIVTANAHEHPDLFWALRGGGGGTFGVVSKLTMATHPMPQTLGAVAGTIRARGDENFRRLLGELVRLVPVLCDDHWGEQIRVNEDNSVEFAMTAVDLDDDDAQAVWQPFLGWIEHQPQAFASDVFVVTVPFESFWDPAVWDELAADMICHDNRPGESPERFWWATNQGEVFQYLHAYQSRWVPGRLFEESPERLAAALFESTRHWHLSLHFNKALWGAHPEALARDRATSINPAVFDAAVLIIAASQQQYVYPGIPGYEPDTALAAACARRVTNAMNAIRAVTPRAGSYVNETDYFESDWQHAFWGSNYDRLCEIKQTYDPAHVFRVHHGVVGGTVEEPLDGVSFGPKRNCLLRRNGREQSNMVSATEHVIGAYVAPPTMRGRNHKDRHDWTAEVARAHAHGIATGTSVNRFAWEHGPGIGFPTMRRRHLAVPSELDALPAAVGAKPFGHIIEATPTLTSMHARLVALDPGGDLAGWQGFDWYDAHTGEELRLTTDLTDLDENDGRAVAHAERLHDTALDWARPREWPLPQVVIVNPMLVRHVGRSGHRFLTGYADAVDSDIDTAGVLAYAVQARGAAWLSDLAHISVSAAKRIGAGARRDDAIARAIDGLDQTGLSLSTLLDLIEDGTDQCPGCHEEPRRRFSAFCSDACAREHRRRQDRNRKRRIRGTASRGISCRCGATIGFGNVTSGWTAPCCGFDETPAAHQRECSGCGAVLVGAAANEACLLCSEPLTSERRDSP